MPITWEGVDFATINNVDATQTTQTLSLNDPGTGISFNLTPLSIDGTVRMQLGQGSNFVFINDFGADDAVRLDLNGGIFSGTASNPITLDFDSYNAAGFEVRFINDAPGSTQADVVFNNPVGDITGVTGTFTAIIFTSTNGGSATSFDLDRFVVNNATCFAEGVLISTPDGKTPVEDLCPGDFILTQSGALTRVHWVGRQSLSGWFNSGKVINPICIEKGALGPALPSRDLRVSPDHAICIDGVLYAAAALINDVNIYQAEQDRATPVRYFHVETEHHELLLAEDCPAESYIAYADPFEFENADERDAGRVVAELEMPRVLSRRLVPVALKDAILNRAERVPEVA